MPLKKITQREFDLLGYTFTDALCRISKNSKNNIVKEQAFIWADTATGDDVSVEVVVKRIKK
ncbi:helix-turn-helix domain-containing protein [uncultured Draconibacterium sp.]|uniref:helix-turn-helix domain-containing protein n=1 Tax=uncultured Draconibacterium sp. TaxID=1573823 RepID=UPI003216767E